MATAFTAPSQPGGRCVKPMTNWRYDTEDVPEPSFLPTTKPASNIDPVKRQELNRQFADFAKRLQEDVEVEDDEVALMKNFDKEKSVGSISLSMASQIVGNGGGEAIDPDFVVGEEMLANTPMPMKGVYMYLLCRKFYVIASDIPSKILYKN